MRLTAALQCDLRLQWRNGFYYATALIVVCSIIFLKWLSAEAVALLLPVIIFENVVMNSFYFVSGLILLENGEGTRAAQVITPLRSGEYLLSKAITLGVLSLVESLLITFFVQGLGPGFVSLVLGIALASALLTFFGIAFVCRYHAINEFLMPSVLFTFILAIPLLSWFGFGDPILYDWHPLQGPLQLMGARYELLGPGRFMYAIAFPLLWLAPMYLLSRRSLSRSVRA